MAGKKGRTGKHHKSTAAKRGGKKDRRFKRNRKKR
jgi:hypothetical protein